MRLSGQETASKYLFGRLALSVQTHRRRNRGRNPRVFVVVVIGIVIALIHVIVIVNAVVFGVIVVPWSPS